MKYRALGSSSLESSAIGVGGCHFGVYLNQKQTTRLLHHAFASGINLVDTSPIYGREQSESMIGRAIRGRRHQVLVATKAGLTAVTTPEGQFGVKAHRLTRDMIRTSLEKSLKALGTDAIDLFQLHAFDPETPLEETTETLGELIKEGKIRAAGCSNFDPAQLESMVTASTLRGDFLLASAQVHYNLIERRAEREFIPICREHDISVIVNRALARGILTGKYQANQPPPAGSRGASSVRVQRWLEDKTLYCVAALGEFARARGYSVTALSLSWLLSRHSQIIPLVGVRDCASLDTCLRATEWVLSGEEIRQVSDILETFEMQGQVEERPEVFLET